MLDVASMEINRHGAGGMTLEAVARRLGLDQSSVSYYFGRKEDLVAACRQRTLLWKLECARRASAERTAARRLRAFLFSHLSLVARSRQSVDIPLVRVSNIRVPDDAPHAPLLNLRGELVEAVRALLGDEERDGRGTLCAHQLLSVLDTLPTWLEAHTLCEFGRLGERLLDVLESGIGITFDRDLYLEALPGSVDVTMRDRFGTAAATVIDQRGYRGASVDRIADELGVSNGSFYHHFTSKDELIEACFDRNSDLLERAHARSDGTAGGEGAGLAMTISSLVALRLGDGPLLGLDAHLGLPGEMRAEMARRGARETVRLAGRISDAVADGSCRPVDPKVAAHVVEALVDGAAVAPRLVDDPPSETMVALYLDAIRGGLWANSRSIAVSCVDEPGDDLTSASPG
ncbi:TetR/AcrR family transcriptional regulator [Sphingomonas corticis]|uniref:TetR/AcrR family transcriptional regulator n=1 Tax=Sphingomonas corticis TaxID=2722791 RepID=A0ABX1CRT6_9SPHN|nr:TetR/AcrR family transcriptional regulator [Sphingomonas corticis]NJR80011.1 TetR/AcrR family transcriptional regulator [Sphingomonas corticis]